MKKILFIACGAFLIFSMSGCIPGENPHLTIQSHTWRKEWTGVSDWWEGEITGQAVNDGNVILSYAEVWALFYDSSGTVIEKKPDNTFNLKIGEVWQFSIIFYVSSEPDHYEINVGTLSY
ncbi:MAG TPA: hypothetical protein ENI23_10130 [bacterium]|nr:hypothetical protein [bacterium]